MANIYLKVPTYVAQFYRSRDVNNQLGEFQPVEFSPFQQESTMIAASIMFVSEQASEHTMCFSERMWKNILNGKKPQGGKMLLKRDATEWPTMDEVNCLTDMKRNKKTDGFDYLCIAAPKSIVIGGQYKQVTTSFTLPFRQSNELVRQLRTEFIRILLNWVRKELALCDERGIQRDVIMCIDHFFYHYNMCLGTNGTDRDSMRRMAMRWIEDAKMLADDIQDEDVLFTYEKETEHQASYIDSLLDEIKQNRNKVSVLNE
ncbi:MAG: hypothetical protein IKR31_03235 [Prevotella sp.]|nr:hypothetical protein [Prevotella sp.]